MDGQEAHTPEGRCGPIKTTSLTQSHPHAGSKHRRRYMKRSRSAPDCKHGISSRIKIGLCAMDKKAQSKPMREIIARLVPGGEFEVVTFGDQLILESPVEAWPLCDVMLSWHSEGFPLRKAQAYVELRRPFLINDVHMQDVLLDRRRVYKTLMDNSIPVPRHILVNRVAPEPVGEHELTTSSGSAGSTPRAASPALPTPMSPPPPVPSRLSATGSSSAADRQAGGSGLLSGQTSSTSSLGAGAGGGSVRGSSGGAGVGVTLPDPPAFVEGEDYVELAGVRIDKPFVEKPASGEDHNIYIYYPHSMGGGVKRLFRKVDNKSADYDPHHPGTVRRDGSYIYEEFLTTGGTDVKVYTVGPRYAHAEARKSPVVDGKVNRTADGKEVRFPVLLSPQEKEIARMVCLAFGQRVCGFDLLRSETGRSYVCDVNGWSFVKNSKKYYDDAAGILRSIMLSQLAPHRLSIAPETPMPLAGLLEEVAAAGGAAADSMPQNSHGSTGSFDDDVGSPPPGCGQCDDGAAAIDAAAVAHHMREVSSLQDLTSLDGGYDEEGTDDSSSTAQGGSGADSNRWLELRCVLAVVRHGDRTPKQKMKVTVTQAPLLELFTKYKDSKGKQAKLKSPGQLQELLDVTRQLLADMEAKSAAAAAHKAAGGGSCGTDEERQQELHEEQREKLRIVRTVLEQGGTFAGINRKVQLKPTKWSRKPPAQQQDGGAAAAAGAGQGQDGSGGSTAPAARDKQQGSAGGAAGVRGGSSGGDGSGSSVRGSSSSGGAAGSSSQEGRDGQPHVSELLLILKYGGVLTHAGRAQSEELGKMFRMVMYPRYGPAGGGLLRLHSTYRHDMKIYSSDEGRVQMSAAAFIKGLLDLEGSSLTPILVSLVTKNASMLDAFGKGASDDILSAKNMLYQHLTWDQDKATSLCSRLALPLNTPANTSPPLSPRSGVAAAEGSGGGGGGSSSPFMANPAARARLSSQLGQVSAAAAADPAAGTSSSAALATSSLPTTSSCLDLLQQGRGAAGGGSNSSGKPPAVPDGSSSTATQQQQPGLRTTGSYGTLAAAAAANAAAAAAAAAAGTGLLSTSSTVSAGSGSLSKIGSCNLSWVQRQAEARAAALSGIRSMPDRPLTLLYQLVELMKVLVDALREKCLEERSDLGGGPNGGLHYSSLTTAPDDWHVEEARPCSGERLLLMFDRWRKLLKSFFNEKKQQFDISKVPDIYDSAKYDTIHNSHLALTCLKELYTVSRQLASVVVPHEYGLDGPGKLLIGGKICAELLGKLMCDLDSMKEESIVTAAIEADTAAARAAADKAGAQAGTGGISRNGRGPARATSHASLLDGRYDPFAAEFGQMSLEDERMRPVRPTSAHRSGYHTPAGASSGPADAAAGAAAASTLDGYDKRGGGSGTWTAGGGVGGSGGSTGEGSQQQQQQQPQGQDQDQEEKETLHRLCPTYASDINSPLRHVRTRIYFTSESHIHSLVNVLRYCHLPAPPSARGSSSSSISHAPSGVSSSAISQALSGSNLGSPAHGASAAAAGDGSAGSAASGSTSAFASAAAAGAASASGTTQPDGPAGYGVLAAAGSSSGGVAQQQQPQPLINPDGQALLDDTDEFDYLTHIVFRMYENKKAAVDSPERFFVEIQFSNGANYDPTTVVPLHDNHTLPTQPRRLLTNAPGVPLQTLQELVGKYARGKNTPSNYQLQVALRAPLLSAANSHAASKVPTPGASRQPSGGPLPPATAALLLAQGPGTVTSAPLPASIVATIAAAVAATSPADAAAAVAEAVAAMGE